MKKFTLITAAVLISALVASATAPANYYVSAQGKSNEALMTALCGIIRSHTQLSYSKVLDAYKTTDVDAQGYIIDIYSNCKYKPSDNGASASTLGQGYNREHSFPKSWFDDKTPMYTDMHHLYPTDIKVNSQRANYPYGVCQGGTRLSNGSLIAKGRLGGSTYSGYSGTVFEPDDEYKGDLARTYFYMVTCYKSELPSWPGSPNLNYAANKYKAFSTWTINMLMEWTRLDPVSDKEMKRNDAVHSVQGNRNPFIDHPELAEYIWGDKQGQAWNGSDGFVDPVITSPAGGATFDMGRTEVGTPLEYTINLKGMGLTQDLSLSMSDNEFFSISRNAFTAGEVNNGTYIVITFSGDEEGIYNNTVTLSSNEASTTFTVTATAFKPDTPGPGPDPVLGDSIIEDWEGCNTGGYWTQTVEGHQWQWDFNDAGIWGDSQRHDALVCRLGKKDYSSITMIEDYSGGLSGVGFYASSYGSDADAALRVDYSTDRGSSWTSMGNVIVTKGGLQRQLLTPAAGIEGNVRVRIVQTAGSRVNVDDVTLYSYIKPDAPGDVNGDGETNIADVNAIIDAILAGMSQANCDINGDGEVNIADINAVIDIILGK